MAWTLTVPLLAGGLCSVPRLDATSSSNLLGKKALILSAALPFDIAAGLEPVDAILAHGASVQLLVPLPRSGAAAQDDDALQLLLRINRVGYPQLMESLGYSWGVGLYACGNRQRVAMQQVRADDVESLALALSDADLLLIHTPDAAAAAVPAHLVRARFSMLRTSLAFILRRLRRGGHHSQRLMRDSHCAGLHWTWLNPGTGSADDSSADPA